MTFYQELQLGSLGSKQLIRNTADKKEKLKHIGIYNLKVYLTVAFCFAFVTAYSVLFGEENSIVGVVVLLSLLVLRQVDFGIKTAHGIGVIALIFAVLAVGPRLSNAVGPGASFFINIFCILAIMVLGCHNVLMSNQSTFLLGYLLLQGYDVTGAAYLARAAGLAAGMGICMAAFYINHKNRTYKRTFGDLFREFELRSSRTRWYFRVTLIISTAMLAASLLKLPRVMWVGIACMSVLLPFTRDLQYRAARRAPFNMIGCGIFLALYLVLPKELYAFIGLLGGICVGFSASYSWQTVYNTFGALAVAAELFGIKTAILLRIATNIAGPLYSLIMDRGLQQLGTFLDSRLSPKESAETI